jgi:phosphoglycolate phosphatase
MVNCALEELSVRPEQAVYVGDSEVDLQTAANAGLPCISVTWGFRDQGFLREHGAKTFIQTPLELLNLL